MTDTTKTRLAIIALRSPPAGAVDFALATVLRRDFDLLSGVIQPPMSVHPTVGTRDGKPRKWLFKHLHCDRVVLISGREIKGDLLIESEIVSADGGRNKVQLRGKSKAACKTVHGVSFGILQRMGIRPTDEELERIRTQAMRPGVAFTHWMRFWEKRYASEGKEGEDELLLAAEAGCPVAWIHLADWDLRNRSIQGFQSGLDEPMTMLRTALAEDPYLISARAQLAAATTAAGRAGEALALVEVGMAWSPESPRLWLQRVYALDAMNRREEALDAMERCWSLSPWAPRVVTAQAHMMHREGLLDQRVELLSRATDALRDDLLLRYLHGKTLCDSGRWPEAHAALASLYRDLDDHPWYQLPFKVRHLDHLDSTRWAIAYPLALAAAGDGEDPGRYIDMHIQLQSDPEAYIASVGGMEGLLAAFRQQIRPPDLPPVTISSESQVEDLQSYARLSFEIERGLRAGLGIDLVLNFWGLDRTHWLNAQSDWLERMLQNPQIAERFREVKASLENNPPPMPAYGEETDPYVFPTK